MNKAQKSIAAFLAISVLVIAVLYIISAKITGDTIIDANLPSGIVLYYGEECPHCKIVEDFMKENDITSKIKIEQKEVFNNKTNSEELVRVARSCNLELNTLGVPFLYSDGKCYAGDKEVIEFLNKTAGAI